MADTSSLPIIWSIAGHDSSGGAGLSADQRAADAMGAHLCPIVACVTAQHSSGVEAIFPLPLNQLQAQLQALSQDMPPKAIKTGLLGSVDLIRTVAAWVRQLREHHPELPLVIDPVLGASAGGAAFSDDAVVQAYRRELLPLATLITPNRAEALRLLGKPARHDGNADELPYLASLLRSMGAQAVVITGGDAPQADWAVDWLDTHHAQGWLCSRRVPTRHHHGSGCTFASAAASAMAQGHVSADAVVLAKMLTTQALLHAHEAGHGPGPVMAHMGQPLGPLPYLGIGRALPWQVLHGDSSGAPLFQPFEPPADGLYGILPDSAQLDAAAQAGLRCLQLRHKASEGVLAHIEASTHACIQHDALLFVNDHWQHALQQGLQPELKLGLHLGQEDLLALDEPARQQLLAARGRVVLGLSSHSAWELARAAGCGASLIACGPVMPTTTKDMPWTPQGEHNLRWWTRHSPAPVVAIGGLLTPQDIERFAACGPAALCVVRGLGQSDSEMRERVPPLRAAVRAGRARGLEQGARPRRGLDLPQPVL
ncbi:bifunctional hydroxymethylpyrimidine kinase/phosphomethylpyrimidine kinase [Aquabacterium sp.]|uniref:bifunctional hydroxymethylpyrimidine kinase/phosphomethylpyrimidine kinase n=1 Tax=Aquabacterium sp. TaxID=1872578 RepID=UPI004037ECAA